MSTREKSSGVRQTSAAAPSTPPKRGRGRPSKYKPEYAKLVVPHMAEGLSLESFAGLIGVGRDTPAAWREQHADFAEAASIGDGLRILFWEKLNVATCKGEYKGVAPATLIFTLKNVAGWRDRQEIAHEHKGDVSLRVVWESDWRPPAE